MAKKDKNAELSVFREAHLQQFGKCTFRVVQAFAVVIVVATVAVVVVADATVVVAVAQKATIKFL